MYLIPLNLDEPFKKIFGSLLIAKAFIQDMLGVKITSIEKLETDHKVTSSKTNERLVMRNGLNLLKKHAIQIIKHLILMNFLTIQFLHK
jgi:hypothetical protein